MDALGGSIESIVRAKTGICKPSRPTFIGHQNDRKVDKLIREGINNQGGVIIENNAKVRLVNISDDDGMVLKQRVSVSVRKRKNEEYGRDSLNFRHAEDPMNVNNYGGMSSLQKRHGL